MPHDWSGTVIQATCTDDDATLALDLTEADAATLALTRGSRLALRLGGTEVTAFYHGSMRSYWMYHQFFGADAVARLAEDPGSHAYLEGARTLGGIKVPSHQEWLRIRPVEGSDPAIRHRLDIPAGTPAQLRVIHRPVPPPAARARLRGDALHTPVLASHPHALTLALDAPALRKLKGAPDGWHRLTIGAFELPIRPRRGIPFELEAEIWGTSDALLFDYVAHYDHERMTVMFLTPMRHNWKGRFPDWNEARIPVFPVGDGPVIRAT